MLKKYVRDEYYYDDNDDSDDNEDNEEEEEGEEKRRRICLMNKQDEKEMISFTSTRPNQRYDNNDNDNDNEEEEMRVRRTENRQGGRGKLFIKNSIVKSNGLVPLHPYKGRLSI